MAKEAYLGGGKLFFTPEGGTETEIGYIQGVTLTPNIEKATLNSYDGKTRAKAAEAIISEEYTLGFESGNWNKENLGFAFRGAVSTATVAIGDPLPDGTTAAVETEVTTIEASTLSQLEGTMKFEGDPMVGANEIYTFHKVSLSTEGDVSLIGDNFRTLSFEATILQDDTITDGSSQFFKVERF